MPSKCVVTSCRNSKRNHHSSVTFHCIPREYKVAKQWIIILGLGKDFRPNKNSVVCSEHFEKESFKTRKDGRQVLKPHSIPRDPNNKITIEMEASPAKPLRVARMVINIGCQTNPATVSTGVQCNLARPTRDVATQCNMEPLPIAASTPERQERNDTRFDDYYLGSGSDVTLTYEISVDMDTSFQPNSDADQSMCLLAPENSENLLQETKFLTFESAIMPLFKFCQACATLPVPRITKCNSSKTLSGTMLIITTKCELGHISKWCSQPMSNNRPLGNIMLSAAMLFSGCQINQVLRMLKSINIACFSQTTYFRMQKAYLLPSISKVWKEEQFELLEERRNAPVVLGGDGRCDSMGHCAKYCTYYIMDMKTNKVLDVQLIQSNEVKSSVHMEKEGLVRALEFLQSKQINISHLVTDRHVQVRKFMKDNYPDVRHLFDIWHFAKGFKKKLTAAAKIKKNSELKEWIPSIINHIYWCVASSDGNPDMIAEKWKSICRHVVNIHEHTGQLFPKCAHGYVQKHWLIPGGSAHKKLESFVTAPRTVQDIKQLSVHYQTSTLECLQKITIHFAPKHVHYFFCAMQARCYLAALHYNENGMKENAMNAAGELRYRLVIDKKRNNQATVSVIKQDSTFKYVTRLLEDVLDRCSNTSYSQAISLLDDDIPCSLRSAYSGPSKLEVLQSQMTRFARIPEMQDTDALTFPNVFMDSSDSEDHFDSDEDCSN